jgi:predicted GNAT family N-acyltransferase
MFRARAQSAFAIIAKNHKGEILGFTRCLVYSSFSGTDDEKNEITFAGRVYRPSLIPMVMLDLICSGYPGVGSVLMRSTAELAKNLYGARLLVLEATSSAAGYYRRFGFRRVPNACDWPSDEELRVARRMFKKYKWERSQQKIKAAASIDEGVGNVLWKMYNRPAGNQTVVMSLCLGGNNSGKNQKKLFANWNSSVQGDLKYTTHATTRDISVLLNANKYYAQEKSSFINKLFPAVFGQKRVQSKSSGPRPT